MWETRSKEQGDWSEVLTRDVNSFLKENEDKSLIIAEQKAEVEYLHTLVKKPTATNDVLQYVGASGDLEDTNMEVDATTLDHVIEDVTYGVLKPMNTPDLVSCPPPSSIQQPMDTQGTQDSLSFPPNNEIG
jgi:hypothetical protein